MKGGVMHAGEPPPIERQPKVPLESAENLCGTPRGKKSRRSYNLNLVSCQRCQARIRQFPQLRIALAMLREPVLPGFA